MADLGCSPNAAIAYDFFIGKGLRDFQAAAIIGNLQWESGLDPTKAIIDVNGLPSRGIAMWQPPRWQNLLRFADGRDPLSLDVQLEFVWNELPSAGLVPLMASTGLPEAVTVFQDRFEKPRKDLAHTDQRIARAQAALVACPSVKPPQAKSKNGAAVAKTVGVAALVTAIGYGIYKVLSKQGPERPQIQPEPRIGPRLEPIHPPVRYRP